MGLEGVRGKILIVHEHNPHVIPIDPLSHSRINSFDNTQAEQELGDGIQNKRRWEASLCTDISGEKHSQGRIQKPAELQVPTSSSPLALLKSAATRKPNTNHAARAGTQSSIQCAQRNCPEKTVSPANHHQLHPSRFDASANQSGSCFRKETTELIYKALQICKLMRRRSNPKAD